jgi:glutathione S-transferase
MKLFDNPSSPYALKVRIALYEKGLDFEKHEIRFHHEREELLHLNPRGEVPALQDGDTVVYDSRVIVEYLEDKYPTPPLVPADPAGRARCRRIETIADTQLDACAVIIATMKMFRPELEPEHPNALRLTLDTLDRHHANLDAELAGREYLAGAFSRADIAVVPHLTFTAFIGCPIAPKHARLTAWFGRVTSRPSVQRATQEAIAFFEASQKPSTDPAARPLFDPQHLHWRNDRVEALLRVGLGPWLLAELEAGRGFFSPVP